MNEQQPSARPTAFTWNAGGWFGSQVGGTLWMLLLGLFLLPQDPLAGAVGITAFAIGNLVGLGLWSRRAHMAAYPAIQILLLVLTLCTSVVVLVAQTRGLSMPRQPGALVSTEVPVWIIFIFPALMVMFYLRERSMRPRP